MRNDTCCKTCKDYKYSICLSWFNRDNPCQEEEYKDCVGCPDCDKWRSKDEEIGIWDQ